MALDSLFLALATRRPLFVVGFDASGAARGFPALRGRVGRSRRFSLSSMPRLRESTPNGFNEWLICEAIAWAREQSYTLVSLNFSPFAALLAPERRAHAAPGTPAARAASPEGAASSSTTC
jgi:hypothetical protein